MLKLAKGLAPHAAARSGPLPAGLLVSWYGDDFTGSAAVMEVMALAGLPAVLFFDVPTPDQLEKFSGYRGIGIAGVARSKDSAWMRASLPEVFAALARWRAPITHYKVCSTLDSAPQVGSIGAAIELAARHFSSAWIPLLPAAPAVQRYQLFGNLFAVADGVGYRLDRHPTMSRHPVTPMHESDIRRHLSEQTQLPIGLIDYLALQTGTAAKCLQSELAGGGRLVAIDVLDEMSLIEAGRLIWTHRSQQFLAVGSQGIEYALIAYWRQAGLIDTSDCAQKIAPVERIAVVSGSCSPVTARQITWAEAHGFEPIRLDVRAVVDERAWLDALETVAMEAAKVIGLGRDPLIYTARGPEDSSIAQLREAINTSGMNPTEINERIGHGLGIVLDNIFRTTGLRRGVLAGGDTSSHGARALRIHALTFLAPASPGAGLCRAHSDDPDYARLEIALKGGQMGAPDYFGQIKHGGAACPP